MDAAGKLYRAHSTKYLDGASGTISNPNLRRIRRPRDMPQPVHETISKWFIDKFGISFREVSLFCSGDRRIAEGYKTSSSTVICLEPVGDFSLCYSESCKDLFTQYQFKWLPNNSIPSMIRDDLDSFEYIHLINGGLNEAARSGNEVMIHAMNFKYRI